MNRQTVTDKQYQVPKTKSSEKSLIILRFKLFWEEM